MTTFFKQQHQNPAPVDFEDQLDAVHEVLKVIFDRKAALLPSYFIVNELLKSYPENALWPHWRLVPMVSNLVNSFRAPAQMVSSRIRHHMRPVVEVSGRAHLVSTWKVDTNTFKFSNRGTPYERILPFAQELCQPQTTLVRSIMRQPSSKELINTVLGIAKPPKDPTTGEAAGARLPLLEKQIVLLILEAVDLTQSDPDSAELLWRNLTSLLVYFFLYQFISVTGVVEGVYKGLKKRHQSIRGPGRDQLLWVLFHYLSGSLQRLPIKDFGCVLKLLSFYDESEPLPVPDIAEKGCQRKLAAALTYMFLVRKSQTQMARNEAETARKSRGSLDDHLQNIQFSLPPALRKHYEFLRNLKSYGNDVQKSLREDYLVPLLINTFQAPVANQGPMHALLTCIAGLNPASGGPHLALPGQGCLAHPATEPLSMDVLDAMSVYSKIALVHAVVKYIATQITSQGGAKVLAVAPALVETHARLLVYAEVESIGVKGILNQLLPSVFKQNCLGILSTLLEMFAYRLSHINAQLRLQLLNTLQIGWVSASRAVNYKYPQLNALVETTILKLITGLGNSEIAAPKNPNQKSAKVAAADSDKDTTVLYGESEELNRVLILTLARAVHINGLEQQSWLKDVMANIMRKTPHNWPQETLESFPKVMQEFYKVRIQSPKRKHLVVKPHFPFTGESRSKQQRNRSSTLQLSRG